MSKKEIFFISLVVIIGLSGSAIYNEIKDGDSFFTINFDGDFSGPSHTFVSEEIYSVDDTGTLNVLNSFGSVSVVPGDSGTVKMKLEKNPYASKAKKAVGIKLSAEVIDYFKKLSLENGVPYQRLIDMYLLDCARKKRKLTMKWSA